MEKLSSFIFPFFSGLIPTAFENFKYPWDVSTRLLLLLRLLNVCQVLLRVNRLLKNATSSATGARCRHAAVQLLQPPRQALQALQSHDGHCSHSKPCSRHRSHPNRDDGHRSHPSPRDGHRSYPNTSDRHCS